MKNEPVHFKNFQGFTIRVRRMYVRLTYRDILTIVFMRM